MTETTREPQEATLPLMPMLLSFVAGYVDSYTYLALFGLFVAQVTGSFVIAGAELVRHEYGVVSKLLAILAFIGAGMLTAAIIGAVHRSARAALSLMLGVETALLGIFSALMLVGAQIADVDDIRGLFAGLVAAMAMGAQSVIVRLLMRGVPQTNVMTGNMTQLAIETTALIGAWRHYAGEANECNAQELAAVRKRLSVVLSVASGFLAGAAAGAVAYATVGAVGIPVAAAIVAALALSALVTERRIADRTATG